MSQFEPLPVRPAVVDTYDWIDTSRLSELVARFARVQILMTLFDGDPDKWLDFIRNHGTSDDRKHDLPFVHEVKEKLRTEPHFVDHLRGVVQQFTLLFADSRRPS